MPKTPLKPTTPFIPKDKPIDSIAEIMTQLLAAVPEKVDEAKLSDILRALILLRDQHRATGDQREVDLDAARERLAHLVARLAESGGSKRDSE